MSLHIRFMGFLHTMETAEALSQIYEMLAAFFLHAAHTERKSGDSRLSFNCFTERGWSERVIREALSELKTRVDSKLSVKRHVRHGKTSET